MLSVFIYQVLQPGDVITGQGRAVEGDAEHRPAAQGTGGAGAGQQGSFVLFFSRLFFCLLVLKLCQKIRLYGNL